MLLHEVDATLSHMSARKERKASTALIRDRRTLSTQRIVFLVIAAAAPLAAMIGNVPLALVYGNGAGLPVAYLSVSYTHLTLPTKRIV